MQPWKAVDQAPAMLEKFGLGAEPIWSESDQVWYAKSGDRWMSHPGLGEGLGAFSPPSGWERVNYTLVPVVTRDQLMDMIKARGPGWYVDGEWALFGALVSPASNPDVYPWYRHAIQANPVRTTPATRPLSQFAISHGLHGASGPANLPPDPCERPGAKCFRRGSPAMQLLPKRFYAEEGLGALPDALNTATFNLYQYLGTNGCTQNVFAECSAFQQAFNDAGYTPQISVDGQYGPCTQTALQQALNDSGAGGQAPASCFPGTCANGQYVAPPNGGGNITPPTPNPPPTVASQPASTSPVLVGAAVVAAGLVSYAGYRYWKKHHRK